MTVLLVCAVEAERDASVGKFSGAEPIEFAGYKGISVPTAAGELHAFHAGVGPVAAAATTATLLALGPEYELVLSAGIAGGFAGRADVGDVVWAEQVIAADQGVVTDDGFLSLRELGLPGNGGYAIDDLGYRERLLAGSFQLRGGDVLTLSCMTGTAERAAELAVRYPRAVAEAMEGYGVVEATQRDRGRSDRDLPFAEVRAVSNIIGRRDRSAWNIPRAFDALAEAMSLLLSAPLSDEPSS
jgi:futalosine hydrolase